METLFIPSEEDFKNWIREAVNECFKSLSLNLHPVVQEIEPMLSRTEVTKKFGICANTLNAWVANGLPHYRDKRRVFYRQSEILDYLKKQKRKPFVIKK